MTDYDFGSLRAHEAYKLITGVVQPRPIAWVSTISADGVRNLAPFSFFTIASRDPVTVFLSIGATSRPGHAVKDTLANVLATGELVVNLVSLPTLEAMVRSSAEVPGDVDEFDYAGLEAVASQDVSPPRVGQARVALECRLDTVERIGADTAVFARVLRLHASDGIVDDAFHVDSAALQPVARTAGATYSTDPVALPSPPVPRWDASRT
ncbi:NADH-FMN oxidoreductase RutF, flavin reductase (DIM6/NTAB) family [Amycolatopsis pretoriensis]|uniref:NADH-FMN oxidoreductase RutF, flavin reductase (DIM6/NTAB) family n=1 Tax=Amycolatopsis pretoriensis TaxID=218821 RepID=A0A1H5R1Q0_9PSEU|nr:flavin reductase family protein [Amycolatopsis pretoriensis]SEF32313.1 NADH-FMN oxidoreductase RutF, flavin reductase (DIM6/NTAB) family [Amycolatopsis pretoriensis]